MVVIVSCPVQRCHLGIESLKVIVYLLVSVHKQLDTLESVILSIFQVGCSFPGTEGVTAQTASDQWGVVVAVRKVDVEAKTLLIPRFENPF